MPTINIIADAQKAVSETLRFNNELNNLKNRMTELTAENQRYNASGQLVSSTIKGLTNDNQKFTAVLRENKGQMELVNIQYTKMKQKATEASTVTKDLEKGLADLNRVAGFFATYNLFAGFMNSVQFATQEANKFQIQLSLIRTISQDNQLSFRQWSKEIRMVSDQLGEPLADVAKATYDAISNQIAKGPAVPTFILSAGDLARTTGATVTDSVNLLSSAITTYNKPVSEANYLSALFFKTVDEGRVVVSEMANVFGRVGVQAKAVGVTIEETTATVAFLTKQGVLTSDAFTFMTNLLTQLQKPSKELQAFLNSIGSPTGQLAIARFGFAGFIEKLTEEVKTGNVAATDFFKEIRAEKPFEAISNNFADFKKVTQTFSDAKGLVQNYQKAIDIRGESPADFLNKEFNKVKNLLTEDIGQNILRITTQIVQGAQSIDKFLGGNGSLASGVDRLVNLLRDGIVVMLSFRTATAVAATAAAVLTTQTTAAGVAATVTTTRYQILGATFSRMGIGLIAAGIGLIASRWAFANEQVVKQSDAIDALQERYKKMIEVRNTSVIGEDPNKAFLNQAGNQISGGLDVLAKASVIINQRISVLRDANKRQAEEIGNTFNRYLESLNRGINDMQSKIKEAETLLRNTSKNLVNFQNSLQDNLTQTRLKYATDQQKIVILSTEIDALTQKAEAGLASGDPVQVAEAEKIYDNIIKLATERFSIEEEIRKSQIASGFHIVNTARLEQFQNNLLERRKAITDQMVAAKEKDIETTQKQVDIEKTRAENIKDAFKKFNEFSVTEADGQVKARYKNPVTDRIDTEKVKNEYAQVIKNLEDSLGNDYQTRIGNPTLGAGARRVGRGGRYTGGADVHPHRP